jgi:hypothetical protein
MTEQQAEFRVGSILRRTCLVFARNFIRFSPVMAIAVMPSLLLFPSRTSPIVDLHLPVLATFQLLVSTTLFGQAIVVRCVIDALEGRPVSLVAGMATSLHRFLPIAGLALGAGVLTGAMAGFAAGLVRDLRSATAAISLVAILAGSGLFLTWFVAMPACVVERLGPFRSIGRSRRLTQHHRFKILVLVLLAAVIGTILFAIAAAMFGVAGAIARPILDDRRILIAVVVTVWLTIWSAFLGVLLAVSYHGLRLTKEGVFTDKIAIIFE